MLLWRKSIMCSLSLSLYSAVQKGGVLQNHVRMMAQRVGHVYLNIHFRQKRSSRDFTYRKSQMSNILCAKSFWAQMRWRTTSTLKSWNNFRRVLLITIIVHYMHGRKWVLPNWTRDTSYLLCNGVLCRASPL